MARRPETRATAAAMVRKATTMVRKATAMPVAGTDAETVAVVVVVDARSNRDVVVAVVLVMPGEAEIASRVARTSRRP
jgi:hypothetical protein